MKTFVQRFAPLAIIGMAKTKVPSAENSATNFQKQERTQKFLKTKLVIFVGDDHDNFSSTRALSKLITSSESKGLTVQIFSEFSNQAAKNNGNKFEKGVDDLTTKQITEMMCRVDEKTIHVFVGREGFKDKKQKEFVESSMTVRERILYQIASGGVFDEVNKQKLITDSSGGFYDGMDAETLAQDFERHKESREKILQIRSCAVTAEGSLKGRLDFDLKGQAAAPLLDLFVNPMTQGDAHRELVVPQIKAARAKQSCDVEVVVFGDSHLANIRNELVKSGEYSKDQIVALSADERLMRQEYQAHPFKIEGIANGYNASGNLSPTIEEKLSEVASEKARERGGGYTHSTSRSR